MSNIIPFPNTRITTASRQTNTVRQACEQTRQINFAAMPASITGNAVLNRCVTELQRKGWILATFQTCAMIVCRHPEHQTQWMDLPEAYRKQRALEGVAS